MVAEEHVPVRASGGYPYPDGNLAALAAETRQFVDLGFTHVKIKTGEDWTTTRAASRPPALT